MENFIFLNKKESGSLLKNIQEQFGIKELNLDCIFVKNRENKIYLVSNGLKKLDMTKLRINSLGSYFCKMDNSGIRMTVEGAQLIGKYATKNVLDLDKEQIKEWIKGNQVDVKSDMNGFVLIRNRRDFFGCGLIKNNILLNYFPKTRRLKIVNEES
jgi:NOL1/NOP2/fmu family ribosome biogenesis protein